MTAAATMVAILLLAVSSPAQEENRGGSAYFTIPLQAVADSYDVAVVSFDPVAQEAPESSCADASVIDA